MIEYLLAVLAEGKQNFQFPILLIFFERFLLLSPVLIPYRTLNNDFNGWCTLTLLIKEYVSLLKARLKLKQSKIFQLSFSILSLNPQGFNLK